LLGIASVAAAELTEEQRQLPLEAEPTDPKLAKIVLLAGAPSNKAGQHEYFAGCSLMAKWLRQTPGISPVLCAEGWPKNESVLKGASAVVVYADGGPKLPFLESARWEKIRGLIDEGCGFVMLHQAVDVPETHSAEMQRWLGGVWTKDIGCRGHWDMSFSDFPSHDATRGVTAFAAPLDGWLYNLHFASGAIPLLKAPVPDSSRSTVDAKANTGRSEVVAWAYIRENAGRSFAFTGCDLHKNWAVESQRRFVVNGILWSAKAQIPAGGAPVPLDPQDLTRWIDAKPAAPATATRKAPAPSSQ
jgi:hypothetical protein